MTKDCGLGKTQIALGMMSRYSRIALCFFCSSIAPAAALQNIFAQQWSSLVKTSPASSDSVEADLIRALTADTTNRPSELAILEMVQHLENSSSSIAQPAIAPEIYGRWRLLFTTAPDTASPIQRTATSSPSKFPIYQDIVLDVGGPDTNSDIEQQQQRLVVKQVIQFSEQALLSVNALASTTAYPLPELTERKSTGKVFGLNLLGVSLVGDEATQNSSQPDSRIDFVFDEGYFEVFQNQRIPYPVPFRLPLLRDWVKGWIDITYLSSRLRISRGNKGSLFVLVKEDAEP